LPRRALARPQEPTLDRPLVPAAAQARHLPLELALPHVLLLADPLLARLPAPLRVLRHPDLLRAHLSDAARRRRRRGRPAPRRDRRPSPPLPGRQSGGAARGGQGALPPSDPAPRPVGQPG